MATDKEPPRSVGESRSGHQKPRRSAGMRGSPRDGRPEHRPISTTPTAKPQAKEPERVSASRNAKPKVLMGEVAVPRGMKIGLKRDAFRAFMIARRLRPSEWAKVAGVAPGEIMAFLAGHARTIPQESMAKLAKAAGCRIEDMFG